MRDPHRPQAHLTAPTGWLNDPNGLGQRDGRYHLFYQHNPYAAVHDRIHWGHVTSTDLLHWVDEPVALVPDPDGPDADGCWSGVLVDDEGVPTIVYSGSRDGVELPCLATGSPDLRTWTKDPANPVVPHTPPGVEVTAYRDHCVWREAGRWRQLVGSGIRGVGGTAFLYDSSDLRRWDLVGPLLVGSATEPAAGQPLWSGTMWECVELFRLCEDGASGPVGDPGLSGRPGTDVLVVSVWDEGVTHHPLYATGTYAGDTFEVLAWHRLDAGGRYFYAPQSITDDSGRRVMFGWLQEGRPDADCVAAGWSGVMSLPRAVTLAADGALHLAPVAELSMLHEDARTVPVTDLAPGDVLALEPSGDALDVELVLVAAPGAAVRVLVRADPSDRERTAVDLTRAADGRATLSLDRTAASLDAAVDTTPLADAVPVDDDGEVALRVLVDASTVEVFANGRALTARVYPTLPEATGATLEAVRGEVRLLGGEVRRLARAVQR